ncbi:MAG: hypothetical protein AAF696_11550 [Bacteroidota bacterium]
MHIHIVSFEIPFPANYGGVIDVYAKIEALYEAGAKIHLHCFYKDRARADELNLFCEEVIYYPRKAIARSLPLNYPYIVQSRSSSKLLKRLRQDDYPILFEGIHTTYYLGHPRFEGRKQFVRMHNVEWEYYYQLAQREDNFVKKQYYQVESRQLQHFEGILAHADKILCISPKDTDYYAQGFEQVEYLPAFHKNLSISSKSGIGEYCLYHGNLSVSENHEAVMFLIQEVFSQIEFPFIIAGKDPRGELIAHINEYEHIKLRHNPGDGEMLDLMREAHVHVLPTFQSTGIKLKLINSLYNGRFVLVNPQMVHKTGLEFGCIIAHEGEEFREILKELMEVPFSEIELAQRKASLGDMFSNKSNAKKLLNWFKE